MESSGGYMPAVRRLEREMTMWRVVQIRTRILRLRKRQTFKHNLIADALEKKLLSRMSWTR